MLRLILRHTHNALLLACILLLICSLERLCRYDFAEIQQASSVQPDGLQVDTFAHWAWEHQYYSPSSRRSAFDWFKVMSSASTRSWRGWASIRSSIRVADEYLNVPETGGKKHVEGQRKANKNLRQHNESKALDTDHQGVSNTRKGRSGTNEEYRDEAKGSTQSSLQPQPKIGFFLHLSSCDIQEALRWKQIWVEQVKDVSFLYAVLLEPSIEESCLSKMEGNLESNDTNHANDGKMNIRVFVSGTVGTNLRTCQHTETALRTNLGDKGDGKMDLHELLYYNHRPINQSKDAESPTSSSNFSIRRVLANPNVASEFQCLEEQSARPQSLPPLCKDKNATIMDCRWFQYHPTSSSTKSRERITAEPVLS